MPRAEVKWIKGDQMLRIRDGTNSLRANDPEGQALQTEMKYRTVIEGYRHTLIVNNATKEDYVEYVAMFAERKSKRIHGKLCGPVFRMF